MLNTRTVIVVAAGFIGLVGAVAAPMLAGPDYTNLPPAPQQRYEQLAALDLNLAKAVELAEQEIGGIASAAEFDFTADNPTVLVTVYTKEKSVQLKYESGNPTPVATTEISRFPGEPVTGEPTKTDSGLMYYDLKIGEGEQPTAASQVKVHYTGWLTDGTKFDSSVDRGQPITFPLSGVIPGWTEGVGGMKPGGKRKLIIPYQLGYKERGMPPVIPPKAMLIFDVELLEVLHAPGGDHSGHNH